jgi:Response regulators consisting of a CheY-like receiver domain and a winged-helix DNA-binding domain
MGELAKILIVEDEPKVAGFIKKGLEESNFNAEIAYDGLTGKAMGLSNSYDLIILDINLPLLNGFQLCKLIRENNQQIPILMLTALGGLEEKVKGFDYGADDYLLKPFEFEELLARIMALLKRTKYYATLPSRILRIADLELNRDAKTVKRSGKEIELSAKEFLLLEYLMLNRDRVVSRNELTEKVWGLNFDTGTNVVDVYVNFLRKKMDLNYAVKLIHTRIGLGYVLKEETNE